MKVFLYPSLKNVLFLFAFYIGMLFFIAPLIGQIVSFSTSGNLLKIVVWTHLFSGILSIAFFSSFFFIQKNLFFSIWKTSNSSYLSDIFKGVLYYLIAFPCSLIVTKLLESLTTFFFHPSTFPEQTAVSYLKLSLQNPFSLAIALFVLLLYAPCIEELLFRGLLQNFLSSKMKSSLAIFLTSGAFAFFHLSFTQKYENIPLFGALFIFSLFLGFLYEKQKSLLSSITLHALLNSWNVSYLIFFKKGFFS